MLSVHSSRNSKTSGARRASSRAPLRRTITYPHNGRSSYSKRKIKQSGAMTLHTPSTLNGSFSKMRDSLTRSLSLNYRKGGKSISSNHSVDEMNVFASDIVSKEFILERLKEVRHNSNIVKLEVEDLLIARNHNSFLPIVKAILVTEQERNWQCLRFVDTIPSTDFLWWQGMKHVLMREYEDTFDDISDYANVVSFNANIQVMAGCNAKAMCTLLKNIIKDKDVENVYFGGALYGYNDGSISRALMGVMDEETGLTKQAFVITVKCGWQKLVAHKKKKKKNKEQAAMEEDDSEVEVKDEEESQFCDWAKVLKNLHRTLRLMGRTTNNPQDDDMDARSIDSTGTSISSSFSSSSTANSAEGPFRRTTSAEGPRRIPRSARLQRRPPQRTRSGSSACSSSVNEQPLPIVRQGSRRSIHMPATRTSDSSHASVSRSPVRSPTRVVRRRPPVQRSTSLRMRKRPSMENLDDLETELLEQQHDSSNTFARESTTSDGKAPLRRSNSLNVKRSPNNSLLDDVIKPVVRSPQRPSRSAAVAADFSLFMEMPANQPAGSLDSWLDKKGSGGRRHRSRSRKSKKQLQRSKSLNLHRQPLDNNDDKEEQDPTTGDANEEQEVVNVRRPPRRHHSYGACRSKSHRHHHHHHHHEHDDNGYDSDKTPDYDWSVGEYVEKPEKKTRSRPAAVAPGPIGNHGCQCRCPAA